MSELDRITTEVASSITAITAKKITKDYNELYSDLITCFNLTPEEAFKLKEGFVTEKNKASPSIKLFSELMTGVLDSNKKDIADKDYYQNIPGLNMGNTMSGVFQDGVARRGTKTYESINDYLNLLIVFEYDMLSN